MNDRERYEYLIDQLLDRCKSGGELEKSITAVQAIAEQLDELQLKKWPERTELDRIIRIQVDGTVRLTRWSMILGHDPFIMESDASIQRSTFSITALRGESWEKMAEAAVDLLTKWKVFPFPEPQGNATGGASNVEATHSVADLTSICKVKNDTLKKYGKPAIGRWISRGQSGKQFTLAEVLKIVIAVKTGSSESVVMSACEEWLSNQIRLKSDSKSENPN